MQNDDDSFMKNAQKLRKNLKKLNKKKSASYESATEQDIFWSKKNKSQKIEDEKEE